MSGRYPFFDEFRQRSFLTEEFKADSFDLYCYDKARFNQYLEFALADWRRNIEAKKRHIKYEINGKEIVDIKLNNKHRLLSLWKEEVIGEAQTENSNPFLIFLSRRTRQTQKEDAKAPIVCSLFYALCSAASRKDYLLSYQDCEVTISINYNDAKKTLHIDEKVTVKSITHPDDHETFNNTSALPMLDAHVRYAAQLNPMNGFLTCKCTDLVIKHYCKKAKEVFDTRTVFERIKDWFKWFFNMNKMPEIKANPTQTP